MRSLIFLDIDNGKKIYYNLIIMNNTIFVLDINTIKLAAYAKNLREKNFIFSAHYHPRIELMYVEQGQLEVTIFSRSDGTPNRTENLSANNYILLDSNIPHSLAAATRVIFYTMEFTYDESPNVNSFGFSTKQLFRDSPALLFDMKARGYNVCNDYTGIKDILGKIQLLLASSNLPSEEYAEEKYLYRLYIQELFVMLCLNATKNKPHGIRLVRIINEYLSSNFQRKLDLDKLATLAGISKFYMEKLYKKTTGQTIRQFLTILRLEKAKSLLRTTTLPIQQIAKESGFNIRQQLIYNFKNYYNITPSEYASSQTKELFETEIPKNISKETYDFVSSDEKRN